jgi:hypothetical protein
MTAVTRIFMFRGRHLYRMADASSLSEAIEGISSRVSDDMSEQDVENASLNEDFSRTLGYEGAGIDLRSEFTLPDARRPPSRLRHS